MVTHRTARQFFAEQKSLVRSERAGGGETPPPAWRPPGQEIGVVNRTLPSLLMPTTDRVAVPPLVGAGVPMMA